MKPTLVLVGRPNVGKSTLFNRLTRTRDAIVADIPGLTRDRHYGQGRVGDKPYLVMDTGGFEPVIKEGILHAMAKQTLQAIDEADKVIVMAEKETWQDFLINNPKVIFWNIKDPEGMPDEEYKQIILQLKKLIEDFMKPTHFMATK